MLHFKKKYNTSKTVMDKKLRYFDYAVHSTYLVWYIVLWQLLQHVVGQSVHNSFSGLTATTAGVFWLNVHNVGEHGVGCIGLVPSNNKQHDRDILNGFG